MPNSIDFYKRIFLHVIPVCIIVPCLNLTKQEDITKSLNSSNKNQDNFVVKEIKSMIDNSLNPFNKDLDPDRLFNIWTGKSCKKSSQDFLLNVESIGTEASKSFIQEFLENWNRFEERIKKKKLLKNNNFATESGKWKIREAEGKIIEVTFIRDLFGSRLCLSIQQKIDIAEVLKYTLKSVPLCLSHVNGSVNSVPKSNLVSYIVGNLLQFHHHQSMEL